MALELEHLPKKFGQTIRVQRIKRSLSQEQLAFESGLSLTYVGEIERGEKLASLETVIRLAQGLGISASELFAAAGL